MRQSGNPITKSSVEMEQHVFQKAHSRVSEIVILYLIVRYHLSSQTIIGQYYIQFGNQSMKKNCVYIQI
jgi:hypothetical protein